MGGCGHFGALFGTLGLALGLVNPRLASAHASYSPTLSNRYVKLSLGGKGAIRIAYGIMVGEAPATAARTRADRNASGTLDDKEVLAYATGAAEAVQRGLSIDVDGERRTPIWDAPVPSFGDLRVGPIPFSIDLAGTVRVSGAGPHVVKLDDETALDELGETEVRIEEGPASRVLAAWRGREDGGRQLRFLWNGPKFSVLEDRSIGFRFVDDELAGSSRRWWRRPAPLALALAGALGGAIVAAAMLVRSARRRRRHKIGIGGSG